LDRRTREIRREFRDRQHGGHEVECRVDPCGRAFQHRTRFGAPPEADISGGERGREPDEPERFLTREFRDELRVERLA
jgi:hypothetical protein